MNRLISVTCHSGSAREASRSAQRRLCCAIPADISSQSQVTAALLLVNYRVGTWPEPAIARRCLAGTLCVVFRLNFHSTIQLSVSELSPHRCLDACCLRKGAVCLRGPALFTAVPDAERAGFVALCMSSALYTMWRHAAGFICADGSGNLLQLGGMVMGHILEGS